MSGKLASAVENNIADTAISLTPKGIINSEISARLRPA